MTNFQWHNTLSAAELPVLKNIQQVHVESPNLPRSDFDEF